MSSFAPPKAWPATNQFGLLCEIWIWCVIVLNLHPHLPVCEDCSIFFSLWHTCHLVACICCVVPDQFLTYCLACDLPLPAPSVYCANPIGEQFSTVLLYICRWCLKYSWQWHPKLHDCSCFLHCWTQEEESKLRKAFGDSPIPGTWKWDQMFQHRSDRREKGGGDEFSTKKQIFADSDAGAISTTQIAGKGDGRSYDWLQPSRPKEQQKKVRISLDEPLFPDGPRKNVTSPSVEKKPLPGRRAADGSEFHVGSRLGGYEDIHRQLQEERRREYNEMLERKRQEEPQREFKTPSTDSASGLFSRLGSRESMQSRLREERHREYNEMLERKKQTELQRERKTPPVGYNAFSGLELRDGERDRLREERHREYNEMLERKKLAEAQRERNTPPVGSGLFSGLGSREGDREKLREERHQEYKEFLKV